MYIIVRPCAMVLVNKLHMTWFVSARNAALLDISFFCLMFNVTRLSLSGPGEKLESSIRFHPPGLCRGTEKSRCLRKSSSATCSSDSREGCVFDADSSFTAKLGVLEREQYFSTSVSDREQGFSLAVSEREHRCVLRVVSIWRLFTCLWCHALQIITRFSQKLVKHALVCFNHTLVCFYD